MNITQIKETCLYFTNLEDARKFYGQLLGLPIVGEVANQHIFFRAGNSILLCFNPESSRAKVSPPAHYGSGKYHFAFEVLATAYEAHKKELLQKGINITDCVTWPNGLESFYFQDPAGNVVEIVPVGLWD
ncbi:MAG: lactoylglutathione lyase [Bacteroidota bacterium]|nr:MAG: Glyoxalase-like domain protein [Bacteroidetes bacterium OLB12]GIL22033.1 MAG: lactoylglutathione lyase [Bacteroidota bacterium]HNR74958.1 VOC family protein [Cyclobacteriaceae bacterium]HNU41193.1 VOC family protein [Cyclobacteriaceae bacterium]